MLTVLFLAFAAGSFGLILLVSRSSATEKQLDKRLQIISVSPRQVAESDGSVLLERRPEGFFHELGEYVQRFHFAESLEELILHADSRTSVGAVVSFSIAAAILAGLFAHLIAGSLVLDLLAVAVGASIRWFFLGLAKSRRLKKFNNALPDAIELIARALRAGHSINSALEIVGEQASEPLRAEFAIVYNQQKFGLQFRDALLQLGDRVPSKDLSFLITAMLVQKETGGDLTEILDRTTHVIRERIRIEGEIRTYTAQGRLTGWILGLMPIIMLGLINLMSPGYSNVLFHDPTGQKMLYAGGILIVIGGLIIRKIVDIKV